MNRDFRDPTRLTLRAAVAAGALVSIVVCVLIARQSLILGSPSGGWFYHYQQRFSVQLLGVFVLAFAPAGILLAVPDGGRREWVRFTLWLAAAAWMQAVLRTIAPFSLETLFVSDGANSFYGFAQQHAWTDLLAHFARLTGNAPLHAQSNLPGKVTLIYALQLLTRNPQFLSWMVVAISTAGGVLIYAFVRMLFADARVALLAAVLYWFYPARLFFLPIMNTVTPLFILGCGCVLLWWLRTGRTAAALLLGVTLYVLVFFEPLPLVMGLLFLALSLRAIAIGGITPQRFALQAGVALMAFIVTSEAIYAATGFELVRSLQRIAAHAASFNATEGRPYAFWALENPAEFLFGIGPCQATLFFAMLVTALRGREALATRLRRPIAVLSLGLLAVLIAVDAIGINRGEVIRLWIFLGCFFQIPAAYACAMLPGRGAFAVVLACSLLQATLGLAMIGFVVP
jgi:hypothetical protein